MNCSTFRETMYLREDEVSPAEWTDFQRHRITCERCAAEYRRVERALRFVDLAAAEGPLPGEPHGLGDAVVSRIVAERLPGSFSAAKPAFQALLDWLGIGWVRVSLATALVLIWGSFAAEYSSGYLRIVTLESELTNESAAGTTPDIRTFTRSDLSELSSLLPTIIPGKDAFFQVSGDWIVINKASMERFILLYNDLQALAPLLPPEFRAAHPELWKLLSQKQKTPPDMETLLRERQSLIRELNDLLPQERKTP